VRRGARSARLFVALVLVVGCRALGRDVSGRPPVAREAPARDGAARIDALLATAGQDLYSLDEAALASVEARLLSVDFLGSRLRAPERVDVTAQQELPLLYARRATGQRDWEVAPSLNTILVAVDLERGGVYHGWAFRPRKRHAPDSLPRSRQGAPPEETDRTSINAQVVRLEARELLGLPWRAGRYALTVISWDWVSNTVVVELTEGNAPVAEPGDLSAEQARALLDVWRKTGAVSKNTAFVIPKSGGVTLSSPERIRRGTKALVQGTLRMPVPAGMTVTAVAATRDMAAFLPFGLLLLRKDEPGPPLVMAAMPVPLAKSRRPEGVIVEQFGLDLHKVASAVLQPGEYQLYLVAGRYIDGPRPARVTQ